MTNKDAYDIILNSIPFPHSIEVTEALILVEKNFISHNSAMDAICALNSAECEHSTGNVGDKLACIYVGECPHKQHQ